MTEKNPTAREKARLLAYAAINKKALEPLILDLHGLTDMADYFVIVSGNTEIQVRAILQELQRVCKEQHLRVRHAEGEAVGTWVLLDLEDVVVHVFRHAERQFYDLEGLWQRAGRVNLPKV